MRIGVVEVHGISPVERHSHCDFAQLQPRAARTQQDAKLGRKRGEPVPTVLLDIGKRERGARRELRCSASRTRVGCDRRRDEHAQSDSGNAPERAYRGLVARLVRQHARPAQIGAFERRRRFIKRVQGLVGRERHTIDAPRHACGDLVVDARAERPEWPLAACIDRETLGAHQAIAERTERRRRTDLAARRGKPRLEHGIVGRRPARCEVRSYGGARSPCIPHGGPPAIVLACQRVAPKSAPKAIRMRRVRAPLAPFVAGRLRLLRLLRLARLPSPRDQRRKPRHIVCFARSAGRGAPVGAMHSPLRSDHLGGRRGRPAERSREIVHDAKRRHGPHAREAAEVALHRVRRVARAAAMRARKQGKHAARARHQPLSAGWHKALARSPAKGRLHAEGCWTGFAFHDAQGAERTPTLKPLLLGMTEAQQIARGQRTRLSAFERRKCASTGYPDRVIVPDRTDRELINHALRGEEAAWNALVDRYGGLAFSTARRAGLSRTDAEDVSQTVFAALVRSLASLRESERLAAWIATSARREAWRVARVARAARSTGDIDDAAPIDPDEHSEAEAFERRTLVTRALASIDDRCRELLQALFLGGQETAYEAIGRRFNITANSVGPIRNRCLRRLLESLERLGFEPSTLGLPARSRD